MQDLLESLKTVPGDMLSNWVTIPVFTGYHFLDVWLQDNKPESISEQHWTALGRGILELMNFSFFSIYSKTEPGTANLSTKIPLQLKISEQRMFEIVGPAVEPPLTSLHPPIMPKYAPLGTLSRPLVTFGPTELVASGGLPRFAHSSTGYPQQY